MGDNSGFIDQLVNKIAPSVNGNYAMRESSSGGGFGASGTTYTEESYRTFVGRMKSWWNTRYTNFDNAVQQLSVTGTCPSAPPASAAPRVKSVNAVRVSAVKNGVSLNVADRAVVKVYGLDGKELRRVGFEKGNHTLRFGDMPRGMYIVRVSMGENVTALKVPVR
jgi:hypothetical protein